jgi:hypothetical protein
MRKRRSVAPSEDSQYCVFCDAVMPFERVDAADHPVDDPAGEWICVACGTALLIGAAPQYLHHTA